MEEKYIILHTAHENDGPPISKKSADFHRDGVLVG
jgi:hypothetical protein